MSTDYTQFCDDFYVSCRLFLKLDLALERETVLHFFDRVRKDFPDLQKFRRREDGCLILEGVPTHDESRRWIRLEPNSLRFGHHGPPSVEAVRNLANVILEQAPYHLTFSELDYDHLEIIYGFDLEYRGNHDQLVAETLWADHPLGQFVLGSDAAHAIDAQPYFGAALTEACDLQAYIETKSRTSTFEVRSNEYERQPLSIFLTLRKYWNIGADAKLVDVANNLFDRADQLAGAKVIPLLVNPLAQAIASRL